MRGNQSTLSKEKPCEVQMKTGVPNPNGILANGFLVCWVEMRLKESLGSEGKKPVGLN